MPKIRISRLWIRQILKLAFGIAILLTTLILVDVHYNFLPPSIQSRILLHQPGHVVVNVKIETCRLQSKCPISDGNWFRIPKDLYLNTGWGKHGFVYVQRLKEEELTSTSPVVLDVAIYDDGVDKVPTYVAQDVAKINEKAKEKGSLEEQIVAAGWKKHDNGLWLKTGKYNPFKSVTSIDILYGPDAVDPRDNWDLRPGYIAEIADPGPRLTVRLGQKTEKKKKPELRVGKDHKFKIVQLADLHFSTGEGKCRDLFPKNAADAKDGCKADARTLKFIEQVLDNEKPNYVVLTGDQIYGQASPDSETSLLKVVAPLIKRKIPYSMVMGNHDDDDGSLSRHDLMALAAELPYSLTELGPEEVSGFGNYVQQALGQKSDDPALSFYFLDSHSRSPDPKAHPGYAWVEQNQLDWLKQEYTRLKPGQDEYSHIHMSMAFMHIPFTEYVSSKPFVGKAREPVTASLYNLGTRDTLASIGVSVVSVGHDHVNDYCMYHDKVDEQTQKESAVWLCFGGGTGEGGYGGYGGYERRIRVFEIDTQSATIQSYKLLHENPTAKTDVQVLVKDGKALSPA